VPGPLEPILPYPRPDSNRDQQGLSLPPLPLGYEGLPWLMNSRKNHQPLSNSARRALSISAWMRPRCGLSLGTECAVIFLRLGYIIAFQSLCSSAIQRASFIRSVVTRARGEMDI
jgi:hypothetical protein